MAVSKFYITRSVTRVEQYSIYALDEEEAKYLYDTALTKTPSSVLVDKEVITISDDPDTIEVKFEPPAVRKTDPGTSSAGAKSVSFRKGAQKQILLEAYSKVEDATDDQAGQLSGLADNPKCCYWKRSSELRAAGLIEPTGEWRNGRSGEKQMVCRITNLGRSVLGKLLTA
jgi:hypothetical protein